MATIVRTGPAPVFGWEKITVSTTAIGLTAAKIRPTTNIPIRTAGQAMITCENAGYRFTLDGTTPVDATDTGHVVAAGTTIVLESATQMDRFRAVRVGDDDAVLNVTYFEGA